MALLAQSARLARANAPVLRIGGCGRAAAYRRLATNLNSNPRNPEPYQISRLSSSAPLSSSSLPRLSYPLSSVATNRHFHSNHRLSNQSSPEKPDASSKATEEPPVQKPAAEADQDAQAKDKQEAPDGEQQEGKQSKPDEEAKAPPPPHGSKTPWQVFTDTLSTEFTKSKEWNDSTKQLASGYQEFTQNENLKRVQSAYTKASGAAATTTSAALKGTGRVVGQSAAWVWETPVVKGVRAGANATGRGLEKATRPMRETEAYKNVKEVIDDGSSSRYGGWIEKEERRKRRELREARRTGGVHPGEPMTEDPEAGTNVTLHKDSAWQQKWSNFRDSSKVMQSLFSAKSAYQESENPLISTARSISDRVAGFFAENETAMVIKKFREMDPSFQVEPFLQEMREYILPEVLDAYVKGDIEVLKLWLSAAQYSVYAALMQQYTAAGLKSDGRILDIRHVDIVSAKVLDPGDIPIFLITCRTQEVHVYKKLKTNELAAGMDDKVQQVTYVIGVTRIPEDVSNPETRGWRLIELHKSARDYI